ncbi:MAG: hypothetical protein ACRCU5_10400 [Rhizobiaceae bacterium]
MNCLIVSAILLASLVSAHAGKRNQDQKLYKYRNGGLSFGVVVGGPALRNPKHKLRTHRHKPVVKTAVRGCSPRQASKIALEYGIRYQTIYRSSHTMTVSGYTFGKRTKIRISRAPNCKVLG